MDDVKQDSDGTWTVNMDVGDVKPITGVPTKELAERIRDALWDAHKAGADAYAMSEH